MAQGVLFARVGWMRWYRGVSADDPRPIGGGAFTKKSLGKERFNFLRIGNHAFGYFQPQLQPKARRKDNPSSIHLEKIQLGSKRSNLLKDVLVIFVARKPKTGGQFVVGWYKNATVHRHLKPSSEELRQNVGYFVESDWKDAVLVPEHMRDFPIPSGKGGLGTANICYLVDRNGKPKDASWTREAAQYALNYKRENAAQNPETASDQEIEEMVVADIESSAGYQSDPIIRKAVEEYAMSWAKKRLSAMGLKPRDMHKTESYDFLCEHNGTNLFVEIKGTQTPGVCVFLTPNEVKHAQKNQNSALFVVYGINVKGKRNPEISGGRERFLMPWDISSGKLEPRGYTYFLPGIATKDSVRNFSMPRERAEFRLRRNFKPDEFEQIKQGFLPKDMDDKWFIYFDESVNEISMHRSWTGYCIYRISLKRTGSSYEVSRAWVNRNPEQYDGSDIDHDRQVASWLMDTFLLHKERPYPSN